MAARGRCQFATTSAVEHGREGAVRGTAPKCETAEADIWRLWEQLLVDTMQSCSYLVAVGAARALSSLRAQVVVVAVLGWLPAQIAAEPSTPGSVLEG